jgi:hypothetical protein
MTERHAFFLGDPVADPDGHLRRSNMAAIERRVQGNYRVRCGHCGVALAGVIGAPGPVTEVVWRHDGSSFFGTFSVEGA